MSLWRLRPILCSLSFPSSLSSNRIRNQKRNIFGWLNAIFNKVDPSRISEVGPDRACAEWLLRCGASLRWEGTGKDAKPLKDYNSLPRGGFREKKIYSVDATDSAIMEIGFDHFRGLEKFRKLKLKNCVYLTDESMFVLVSVTKDQLEELELSDNGNITDNGVKVIGKMEKLTSLRLENLPGVEDPDAVMKRLRERLPANCSIEWTETQKIA